MLTSLYLHFLIVQMEIITLFKRCGDKSGRISPSSSSHLAAGWRDDGLVTATVTPRSGSGAVNPVEKTEWEDRGEVGVGRDKVGQTGK